MIKLLFIVDNIERARFFSRFRDAVETHGLDCLFVTNCYASQLYLKSMFLDVINIGYYERVKLFQSDYSFLHEDVTSSVEYISNILTYKKGVYLSKLYY